MKQGKRLILSLVTAAVLVVCPFSYAYADTGYEQWANLFGWLSDINGKLQNIYIEIQNARDNFETTVADDIAQIEINTRNITASLDIPNWLITYDENDNAYLKTNDFFAISAINGLRDDLRDDTMYPGEMLGMIVDFTSLTSTYAAQASGNALSVANQLVSTNTKLDDISLFTDEIAFILDDLSFSGSDLKVKDSTLISSVEDVLSTLSGTLSVSDTDTHSVLNTISTRMNTNNSLLNSINERIMAVVTAISQVKTAVNNAGTTLNSIDTAMTSANSHLTAIKNSFDSVVTAINSVKTSIDGFKSSFDSFISNFTFRTGSNGGTQISYLYTYPAGLLNNAYPGIGDLTTQIINKINEIKEVITIGQYNNGIFKVHDEGLYDACTDIGTAIGDISIQLQQLINLLANIGAEDAIGEIDWEQIGDDSDSLSSRLMDYAPFCGFSILGTLLGVWQNELSSGAPVMDLPFRFFNGQDYTVHLDLSFLDPYQGLIHFFVLSMLVLQLVNISVDMIKRESTS